MKAKETGAVQWHVSYAVPMEIRKAGIYSLELTRSTIFFFIFITAELEWPVIVNSKVCTNY